MRHALLAHPIPHAVQGSSSLVSSMARLAALLALLLLLACAAHAAKVKIGVQPGEMDAAGEPTGAPALPWPCSSLPALISTLLW